MQRIAISQKPSQLTTLVSRARTEDVLLLRDDEPTAVLVSAERYQELLERVEGMEDVLAAYEMAGESDVEVGTLLKALGIDETRARVQNQARESRQLKQAS